ncbi:MAG: hypothetical protein M3069_23110 [Chloroflexota bacterium]|nr:hypothetical protein [Chloroflexota bacterium]
MTGNLRLLLLVLLAALAGWPATVAAQTGGAEPTALQLLAGGDRGSARCGAHQVSWDNQRPADPGAPGRVLLRAAPPGAAPVLDLSRSSTPGERLIPLWCGDILGDGSQALGFESFSGGAHCCFAATVVLLQPNGRTLLETGLGNGGLVHPRQLDVGGPLELPATSDVFAYFDDLSFAASPFLPLVFAYDGTHYVEATRQFPDVIAAATDQADTDLTEAVGRPVDPEVPPQFTYQEQESVALRLFALHWLSGDADQALPGIEARVAAPVSDWLEANTPAAVDALGQVFS